MSDHRKQYLDLVRGFAAILMILGHSFIVYPITIAEIPWCSSITHVIRAFHMETFLIVSGVLYKCEKGGYLKYLSKKAQRVFIPYCFFGTFSIILHAYGGSLINGTNTI